MRSTILWNDLAFFETSTYDPKIPLPFMPFMPFTRSRLQDLGSPARFPSCSTRCALRGPRRPPKVSRV